MGRFLYFLKKRTPQYKNVFWLFFIKTGLKPRALYIKLRTFLF
jgi:hypothetical protein